MSPDLGIWQVFDAQVKADLFATAMHTSGGVYLLDPFAIDRSEIAAAIDDAEVAGIIVTNANHARAAASLAAQFRTPLYLHSAARTEIDSDRCVELDRGADRPADLQIIAIDGAAAGEIAVYRAGDGGTLVFGDAVINSGSYGFTLLPAKYCTNVKQLRRSLRQLLDVEFERMLFAHGMPIMANARARLTDLLDA